MGLEPTSGAMPPPVFKTGSSSGRMTSIARHFQNSGSWNRTNASWFRARRRYQQRLPRSKTVFRTTASQKVRGEGFEPPQPGSKPGGLPLADPRISRLKSALRESNPASQLGRLAPLPLGQGHNSQRRKERESNPQGRVPAEMGGSTVFETVAIANWLALPFSSKAAVAGIEPASERLTAAHPYQHENHRKIVGAVGFEPTISCSRNRRIPKLSYAPNQQEHPAGVEPARPPWQGSRLPLHHGCHKILIELSKNEGVRVSYAPPGAQLQSRK